MIRIGDFAKMAQVSVRTLRIYDDLNLLKPVHIDPESRYRYYLGHQLSKLNTILALKELGISLGEISFLVRHNIPSAAIKKILYKKQSEMIKHMVECQTRQERIDSTIRQIEENTSEPLCNVVIKNSPPQNILSLTLCGETVDHLLARRFNLFGLLYQHANTQNLTVTGPDFIIYHMKEYTTQNIEIEFGTVIKKMLFTNNQAKKDEMHLRCLGQQPMVASMIHTGAITNVPSAIQTLFKWISRHGYVTAGPVRELHLFGKETEDAETISTELQIPITRKLLIK